MENSELKIHEFYENNKFNPTTFDIFSDEKLQQHRIKRNNLYVNKLSIPSMVWKDTRVLEVGCSSGENSLLYALMGARLTFVEPLTDSTKKLKELFNYYGMQSSIERIIVNEIENIDLRDKYNIIVAEGFINNLKKRKAVVRKLFKGLAEDGLLIMSTLDKVGFFVESFKSAIAQLYCQNNSIENYDKKVEAIKPFFEDDFKKIPHSRPFELWAKDVLINPTVTLNYPVYGFDEIISDLQDLEPVYYSSWPSYKPVNDLTWHKKTVNNNVELKHALNSYAFRKTSYLLGEEMDEKESSRFLIDNEHMNVDDKIKEITIAIKRELHEKKKNAIRDTIKKVGSVFNGKIKQLFDEMFFVLDKLEPEAYSKCGLLRKYWGVSCHYIVLSHK